MTDREAAIVRVALAMLKSGRANDCRESLELLQREHEEAQANGRPVAVPPTWPLWMRPNA